MDDLIRSLQEFEYYEDPDTIEYINEPIPMPEEVKKAIGDANRGKVHSPEQNRRHSEMLKEQYRNGRVVWNKGKKGAGLGCGTKECYYKGMYFTSRTEAAKHFGVGVSAVSQAIRRSKK